MRWPSDSATVHLGVAYPTDEDLVLSAAWYFNQFGVDPETVCAIVAACTKRRDVELVASKYLLNVSTNKCTRGMAIGSTATSSFLTRLLFPIFKPRALAS